MESLIVVPLRATVAVSETIAVEVLQPDSWEEALELKAAHPDAVPIALAAPGYVRRPNTQPGMAGQAHPSLSEAV